MLVLVACSAFVALATCTDAQQFSPTLYQDMHWRMIGPFRGGRNRAACGVPSQPNVFYVGQVNGGVWKSDDYGRTWHPIFDHEPTQSIGAIAVAPSDPDVIYAGTGEEAPRGDISFGDGVYKSTDGGKTWTDVGLKDSKQTGKIVVDPRNANVVYVAAEGDIYGPNSARGVFRSTDGGKTWKKVLYKDENTGAVDLVFDPTNPRIMYAALYQVRRQPWTFTSGGPGSGIYKSTDEGLTWKQIEGHGLPEGVLGKIGLAVGAAGERG